MILKRTLPLIQNQEDLKGLKMVYKNLEKLLQKYNVKNRVFKSKVDPNYHEVLFREESDIEDKMFWKKYKRLLCNDKLRHSKVSFITLSQKQNKKIL